VSKRIWENAQQEKHSLFSLSNLRPLVAHGVHFFRAENGTIKQPE